LDESLASVAPFFDKWFDTFTSLGLVYCRPARGPEGAKRCTPVHGRARNGTGDEKLHV